MAKAVTMLKRTIPVLMICLVAAPVAQAQSPGGGGRGGHGGGRPGGSGGSPPASAPGSAAKPHPFKEPEIIGVIKAIDPASGRVTIAYEAVEALGWPAGTMPFAVSKTALLNAATVGQKVRFKLEDQQISDLKPF
jgi:Cu/Ag efflux protein CusF